MRKLIIFLFLAPLYLISCNKVTLTNSPSSNLPPDSGGCLITSERFTKDWEWKDQTVSTHDFQPSTDNHYLLTETILMMSGVNTKIGLKLEISTGLSTYTKLIDWKENLNPFPKDSSTSQIKPEFVTIGNDMDIACVKENGGGEFSSFGCQIKAQYDKHIFTALVRGPSSTSEATIANTLNPALSDINSCILELEKK